MLEASSGRAQKIRPGESGGGGGGGGGATFARRYTLQALWRRRRRSSKWLHNFDPSTCWTIGHALERTTLATVHGASHSAC